MLYIYQLTIDVIEQKPKPDICNVVNWCDDNRMDINYNKTKAILIATFACQKLYILPVKKLNITVKGKVLENVKRKTAWFSSRPKSFLELNSVMPSFSPILTIAAQSGVLSI